VIKRSDLGVPLTINFFYLLISVKTCDSVLFIFFLLRLVDEDSSVFHFLDRVSEFDPVVEDISCVDFFRKHAERLHNSYSNHTVFSS